MLKSESIAQLADALSKAQAEMEAAKKDSANPFFKSKYADLASVWDACRGPLGKYGLSVCQMPETGEGVIAVHTMLMHSSGEWISSELRMRPIKDDPQGLGSAITYARRYALAAAVGIAPEDDDGNQASGKSAKVTEAPRTIAAPKPIESLPPLQELVEQAKATIKPNDVIDRGMQVNFNKSFREALPDQFKPQAENIRHDWLAKNGFLDADGNPSSTVITKGEFSRVRDNACDYAKGYAA
jgi:hypothetical protein